MLGHVPNQQKLSQILKETVSLVKPRYSNTTSKLMMSGQKDCLGCQNRSPKGLDGHRKLWNPVAHYALAKPFYWESAVVCLMK
jgi:hypothetical protein